MGGFCPKKNLCISVKSVGLKKHPKKNLCISVKSVGLKKHPKKNLCISVKSVGQNFHRISRMNQRLACLSDYSRICADIWPLANGSRPICAAIVFGHADFADDADFSSWEGFVPQISQIYTDFLWNLW